MGPNRFVIYTVLKCRNQETGAHCVAYMKGARMIKQRQPYTSAPIKSASTNGMHGKVKIIECADAVQSLFYSCNRKYATYFTIILENPSKKCDN